MSKMSLQCIRPYLWFMILHKDEKIRKIWKIKTRYNEIKTQRCSVHKQAKQLLQVTFQISFYFISFSLDPLTQGNSLGHGLGEKTRDSVDSVTRWVSDQTIGEKNNHSVRRPVTRWTVVEAVDSVDGSGLGDSVSFRQNTRWEKWYLDRELGEKIRDLMNSVDSVRICEHSVTLQQTRWDSSRTRYSVRSVKLTQ